MADNAILGAPHAKLLGVKFDHFDKDREEITLRFHAPDSFITPRGSVQGGLVAGFLDEVMGWAHVWATDRAEATTATRARCGARCVRQRAAGGKPEHGRQRKRKAIARGTARGGAAREQPSERGRRDQAEGAHKDPRAR